MDHLNWVMFSGAAGLVLVVGALVAFFVDEAEEMSYRVLHSVDGVISGGVIVGLIHALNGHGSLKSPKSIGVMEWDWQSASYSDCCLTG